MQRIDANLRAIGDWKSAGATVERKQEVGAGEKDDPGALIATQAFDRSKTASVARAAICGLRCFD